MEQPKKPAQFLLFLLVISSFIYWVQSTKDSTGETDAITAVDRSTGGRGGASTGGGGGGGGGGGHNGGGAGGTDGVNSDNTGSSSSSGSGQSNMGATSSDQPRNNDGDRSHRSDAVRSISFLAHFIFAIVGLSVVLLSLLSPKE